MATLGIPHPTGYPLFCLLGHAWLTLFSPSGSPAFKINLLTALCGAVAVGLLCRFLLEILPPRRWYVAAAGALTLGFAPTLWQQCLSCEVYALTCVFLSGALLLAARWQAAPQNNRLLFALAAVYGLALTNHMTMALFLPGFLLFVLWNRPTLWREGRALGLTALCFALPLTLYLYLPWAASAAHGAPVPWGSPTNWANFKAQVTGEMFGSRMFSGWDVTVRQSGLYGAQVWTEFGGPILLLLAAVGAVGLWRRPGGKGRALTLLLGWIAFADVVFAIDYDVFDIYVYFIPSFLVLAVFFTIGASWALDRVEAWIANREKATLPVVPASEGTSFQHSLLWRALPALVLLLTLLPLSRNWAASDESGNYLEDDFSYNILRSAPPRALIVASSNVTFSLWYRRFVLNERPDVVPIYSGMTRGMDQYGAWYFHHIERMYPAIDQTVAASGHAVHGNIARGIFLRDMLLHAAAHGTPIIVIPDARYNGQKIGGVYPSFDALLKPYFDRVPYGVGERLYLHGKTPSAATLAAANDRLWASFQTRGLYTHWADADPMQEHIGRRYTEASLALGALAERAGRYAVAQDSYERVLRLYDVPEARAGLARCQQMRARRNGAIASFTAPQ